MQLQVFQCRGCRAILGDSSTLVSAQQEAVTISGNTPASLPPHSRLPPASLPAASRLPPGSLHNHYCRLPPHSRLPPDSLPAASRLTAQSLLPTGSRLTASRLTADWLSPHCRLAPASLHDHYCRLPLHSRLPPDWFSSLHNHYWCLSPHCRLPPASLHCHWRLAPSSLLGFSLLNAQPLLVGPFRTARSVLLSVSSLLIGCPSLLQCFSDGSKLTVNTDAIETSQKGLDRGRCLALCVLGGISAILHPLSVCQSTPVAHSLLSCCQPLSNHFI